VARLAEILFYGAEIGHERSRITLLVALQIGAILFEVVASQATAIVQDSEMRLMDKIREAPEFAFDRRWREIDDPAFARDLVDAVAFRA
jgi:hypothetical protein